MSDQHNPDVLSCLANLSNDEVFTPPKVVNDMLDLLPKKIFRESKTTFLDIGCKSGVFLREIAKRLIAGLAEEIPDLQKRVDHILHHQLFGIATTELTSLVSRRTLYCSKYPNCKYSASRFGTPEGNIRFRNIPHEFVNGHCKWCGASEDQFGEDERSGLEKHAYEFIHIANPKDLFRMKFDVIVGNPPYQLNDGGNAASAMPIYHMFVEQAKKLVPRYLVMIIPSRWFTGGRGLDEFRHNMLSDLQMRVIHDFPDASECFPGVEIKGGVCYFKWASRTSGLCEIYTHEGSQISRSDRPLLEPGMDMFIRYDYQVKILKKVQSYKEVSFATIVSPNDPYGFDVREEGSYKRIKASFSLRRTAGSIAFYYNGWRKEGIGYVRRDQLRKGENLVDTIRLLVPRVWGGGDPRTDMVNPFIIKPGSCSTETYLTIGPFASEKEAKNAAGYMQTSFFRFMVFYVKNTQQAMQKVYQFVPLQDFSKPWTDEELYKKYKLTKEEIAFIESMIKPME